MPQATVGTTNQVLIAADPDQWKLAVIENLDAANFIAIELGAAATLAGSFQIPSKATSPQLRIPPNTAVNAIASTAACDVRYVVE
jgi:hypothetical protein